MARVIEARGLVKRFRDFTAVAGIDFFVERGECFGLLGPNGAGKTTTIRMVCCQSPVSQGELRVFGLDVAREGRRIKARLGVAPQEANLDPDLTVWQNLMVYSRYYDLPPARAQAGARESLEFFQLWDKRDSPIESLSSGMRRRLILARAWAHRPELLVLDEPTTGLDPQARHLVWDRLLQLKESGTTLLLTTQYMEEAAHLCDRLVIMHQGRILVQGSPGELVARYAGGRVVELRVDPQNKETALAWLRGRSLAVEDMGQALYIFDSVGQAVLSGLPIPVRGFLERTATLEDVYLRLTGRTLMKSGC